jgi:uncharacterized membrane protein YeaQ/YmgE (transglycosylase-associated protein family)
MLGTNSLIVILIVGLIAGWLAGKIMRGRGFGVLIDLFVGIIGSVIGGFLFGLLGLHAAGVIGQLVVATAGAVFLLYLVRHLK